MARISPLSTLQCTTKNVSMRSTMPRKKLLVMVIASATLASSCKGDRNEGTAGKSDEVWAPANLISVAGVPEAAIETALRARLAGSPPARIDDHKWTHVKRLYKMYGDNPLWLAEDGLHTG